MNSFKSQNHPRGQALRLLFPWPERMGIFLPFPGRDRIREIGARAAKRLKGRNQSGGQEEGSPVPLLTPGQCCLPDTDSTERVSSAWHHFPGTRGPQDVRRKTLFCQVAEHNRHGTGQNASVACALHGLLMPLATLPFPGLNARISGATKPLRLWVARRGSRDPHTQTHTHTPSVTGS